MQKNNEGESITVEERTLICSKAETKILLRKYEEIIEVLNDNVRNNNEPRMAASSPDELHALIELLYCGSLFQVLDDKEVVESDKLIAKERGKVNRDKHDLARIVEVVQDVVPHVASDFWLLFNSCYASLVKKSEEEIRELIHMLVTSDPFRTREAFHRGDESKKDMEAPMKKQLKCYTLTFAFLQGHVNDI
ncbi:hypothetical protein RHGRI_029220 [Rhododendron griersonianum]|uniref:Uncharacterized protein n=1 Tax=Rhododendron griersonianum TaxID=479676 RepID=A0AAV6IKP6_9ERIC|nr:hypothetical protein RHGRI_029220 [Rhododendron griersonianum]